MKRITLLLVTLGLILSFSTVTLVAGEQEMDEKKMMEMWTKYSTPGDAHKYLEFFAGHWQAEIKSWMEPGAPLVVSKGESKGKMILGGRYLEMWHKGTMMGQPFEGIEITGYDNFKKLFLSFWIDTMGTGFYLTEGKLDKSGKVRTEKGLWDDLMTGGKSKVKLVYTIVDKDTHTMEMYMGMPDGKEFKNMVIKYTRKK